ncbi:HD domain-containing protein [Modestobacter sp. L9-4]|uniref:HD domain-containing protein n=1 Tax=Modestobacter sp. L9-4 TaxID=2851567 RepID=UPI001C752F80|nr:HD domain-containing protein [Modestobacter sp. L9-4]QXG76722.1 HD domain-containing protein [Modestobacter sp. L9-4]
MTAAALEARKTTGAGPLTERFDEALAYASRHHREQLRKGSRVPYMSHLMSVSAIILEHGGSEDQAIAGLLHDTVEDAPDGEGPRVLAEIREQFGEPVAAIVEACSDGLDAAGNRSGTWAERKMPYVEGLLDPAKKSNEALLVTAADKIHNGSRIAADLRKFGPEFWSTFNAGADQLLWYYRSVDAAVSDRLPGSTIAEALHRVVADLVTSAEFDPVPAAPTNHSPRVKDAP